MAVHRGIASCFPHQLTLLVQAQAERPACEPTNVCELILCSQPTDCVLTSFRLAARSVLLRFSKGEDDSEQLQVTAAHIPSSRSRHSFVANATLPRQIVACSLSSLSKMSKSAS